MMDFKTAEEKGRELNEVARLMRQMADFYDKFAELTLDEDATDEQVEDLLGKMMVKGLKIDEMLKRVA